MDGVIHRTKQPNPKRPFPWGDIIIWASGIMALVTLFRLGGVVTDFLYGVGGVYVFTGFLFLCIYGIHLRLGKRTKIDKRYLCGALMMIAAFFTALHVGFTQYIVGGGKEADLGHYLNYCFAATDHVTPGGVLFGLPSYLLLVISGIVGTYLILGVFFLVGFAIVLNRVVSQHRAEKLIAIAEQPDTGGSAPEKAVDFDTMAAELYANLEIKNKELMRKNRKRLEANKSLLGLGALPTPIVSKTTPATPVPLDELTTPDGISQASVAEAEQLMGGLKMYNDGKAIPWQAIDSTAWAAVPPMTASTMSTMNMNFAQPPLMTPPPMPTMHAVPPTTSAWEHPSTMQWQGANTTWTPPQAPTPTMTPPNSVNPTNSNVAPTNPMRRRNHTVPSSGGNQTAFTIEEPPAAPAPTGDTFKNRKYIKPTLDLIHTQSMDLSEFNAEASEKEAKLNELFQQYHVRAKVHSFNVAPAVTRFEIVPEAGTRVAQIENLRDDMNFVLKTNNTRMESPIEGKNAIGIEVPNHMIGTVSIKDLLGSREFLIHNSPLAICVGKNINDDPVIADLAEMPHLLVAGTTGSGKSVCINTILTSLIYKSSPEELKLLLIDMKGGVELGMYNGLPHMLVERCISNVTHAVNAFKWLIREMDHRYELLQGQRVNNIALYQALPAYKSGQIPAMPYIVMVVDEAADLMSRNKKEVEDCIQNLAQKSRAAGIHIILATQRPSVDVISGVIKANIGTRIAFRVLSGVDSRTILDQTGAETLMGRGDMLFMTAKGIQRVQGCFMTNDELHQVTAAVRDKNPAEFNLEVEDIILNGIPDGSATSFDDDGGGVSDQDPKLVQVLRYAVRENNVRRTLSISEIQRKFSVGFGRAGRIMDQLEQSGFVGADFGNGKPREVLATRDQVAELYGL